MFVVLDFEIADQYHSRAYFLSIKENMINNINEKFSFYVLFITKYHQLKQGKNNIFYRKRKEKNDCCSLCFDIYYRRCSKLLFIRPVVAILC